MIEIRYGKIDDLSALTEIYNHSILNSCATFNVKPVHPAERMPWLDSFREKGPHRLLVATEGGKVLGYAHSSQYRNHPAFSETVETTIYLAPQAQGKGVGTKLYGRLFELLKTEKLHRAVVGIALPNEASVKLHRKLGFTDVGIFDEYAKVGEQYFSSLWMQKKLEEY